MPLTPWLMALIAFVIGIVLAILAIFMATAVLTPAAKQSDSPLIVYGNDG
ncbi:hypothetical protein [Nocardioides sp.]